VYDFALFDLFLKPFGLLRVESWLGGAGWDTRCVNALDYEDEASAAVLGKPKRGNFGTGKFFREGSREGEWGRLFGRRFSRYGIVQGAFEKRLASAFAHTGGAPDVVLVSSGMTYWYAGVREAVRSCRSLFPKTPIAVGGIYASLLPGHCAASCGPDAVIAGDSSSALGDFLGRLGLPVPAGEYPDSPRREAASVLKDAAILRLSRGCPYSCDYCASRVLFPRFSSAGPDAAFESFRVFREAGILNFAFYDDALLVNKEKVFLPFLERVISCTEKNDERPRFFLPNAVHINEIDSRTAFLMKRSGFQEVRMGFESSSPRFHAEHTPGGAKFEPRLFSETVRLLREAGFPSRALIAYVLAGLPGQRAQEAEASLRAARASGARVQVSEFSPVPGSPLWEKAVSLSRYPLAEEPLYQNNSIFPLEWEGFTQSDLQRLKELARSPL
jgi:radical SAM superfamily enzyme YgiQ (UPF0313 family)